MGADKKFGLLVELKSDVKKFQQGMSQAQRGIKKFTSTLGTMAKGMIAAFGIKVIAGFLKMTGKLAGEVQGVKRAFDRLENSAAVLTRLKEATGGTVSEMELMQQAIQAKNFKIPMDVLAKGLEFATKRAAQTGESVQYLAESFVKGLGRESVMILDNLGISAVELNKEVKKTGNFMQAVGNITERELTKMGDVMLTDAQRMQQLGAYVDNIKAKIGGFVLKGLTPLVNLGNKLFASLTKQSTAIQKEQVELNRLVGAAAAANISEGARLRIIKEIQTKYPDFLKNIEAEKISNEDLTKALKETNAQMVERIKLAVLQEIMADKQAELTKVIAKQVRAIMEQQEAEAALAELQDEKSDRIQDYIDAGWSAEKATRYWTNEIERQQGIIDKTVKKTGDLTSETDKLTAAIDKQMKLIGGGDIGGGGRGKTITPRGAGDKVTRLPKIAGLNIMGVAINPYDDQAKANLKDSEEGEKSHWAKMLRIYQAYQVEKVRIAGMEQAAEEATRDKRLAIAQEITQAMSAGINGVSNIFEAAKQRELSAVGDNAAKREAIEKKYAKKQRVLAIGQAVIGVALAVIGALQTKPFIPMGLIAAISAGVMGGIQIAAIKGTPLAKGGLAYGSILANVGEYPGARSNPEIIAPLSKLKDMLGAGGDEVVFVIKGDVLEGVRRNYYQRRQLMR